MRRGLCLLVLLLPLADAAIHEDPTGDVELYVTSPVSVAAGDTWPEADLRSLQLEETPSDLVFRLEVADAANIGGNEHPVDHVISFQLGDARYNLSYSTWRAQGLVAHLESDPLLGISHTLPVSVEGATLVAAVPRAMLIDERGAPPRPGTTITGLHTLARGFTLMGNGMPTSPDDYGTVVATDQMPDDGSPASFEFQLGQPQLGAASLFSPDPTRLSNGEATTYRFPLVAENPSDEPHDYMLQAMEVPDDWSVVFANASFRLAPGERLETEVLVTTLFRHDHGDFDTVLVHLQIPGDDASLGAAQLGIRYTTTPQPAGHHPVQWIHVDAPDAEGEPARAFLNALKDDPRGDGTSIEGHLICRIEPTQTMTLRLWDIPLLPELAMGLDFQVDEPAFVDVELTPSTALSDAHASVRLFGAGELLIDFGAIQIGDADADQIIPLHLEARPAPEADRIAYDPDAPNMRLVVELYAFGSPVVCDDVAPVHLHAGGTLSLPLNEYHDAVEAPRGTRDETGIARLEHKSPAPALLPIALALALCLRRP